MQQITININPSVREHIMFFLKSLPENLVKIQSETTINKKPNKSKIKFGLAKDKIVYYDDIMSEDKEINEMFYGS